MIRKILVTYATRLNEYLSAFHHCPEGMVTVEPIGNSTGERPNKLVICLLNLERETGGGIAAPVQKRPEGYVRLQPPLLMNLNVILAAVYEERQYAESLSILSDALRFIQSTPRFRVENSDYTIEITTLSTNEMNNLWTLMGGKYYPSVTCKIRRLVIDSESIASSGTMADRPVINM